MPVFSSKDNRTSSKLTWSSWNIYTVTAFGRQTAITLGVGVSITVTPCWCYGSKTLDTDSYIPRFNGTERPGVVYLAAILAAYNQKGIPAFGIYGKNVQDADNIDFRRR